MISKFNYFLFCVLLLSSTTAMSFEVTLSQGLRSESVRSLQSFLNKDLRLKIPLTGYYGPITKSAVNNFQNKYKEDILFSQGLSKPTGLWGQGSIKKAKEVFNELKNSTGINNTNNNFVNNGLVRHPVFGLIPNSPTSVPNRAVVNPIIAPSNNTAPSITGTSTVGSILTSSEGSWGGDSATYTYQWHRDNTPIDSANSATYELNYLDFESDISVVVTATNSAGSATATSTSIEDVTYDFLPVGEIAFVGDSITTYIGAGVGNYEAGGYGSQTRALTGSLFDFARHVSNNNYPYFAQGGTRTATHLETYFPAALASGARIVVYHGGTNDRLLDVNEVLSNVESIIQLAIDAESIIVLTPVLGPRNDVSKIAWVSIFNEGVEALAEEYNMPFADWRVLTEESPGMSRLGILYDNLHPGEYGAHQMGYVLANTLMSFLDPGYNDDLWTSIEAGEYGEFFGTQNYKFDNNNGSRPTNFDMNTSSCSGCVITESIVARDDGHGNWWEIDIAPTNIANSRIYLSNPITRAYEGTAQTATSTSITLGSETPNTSGLLANHRIWITGGTGTGQTRMTTAYAGDVATVDIPWETIPDNTSQYTIGRLTGERVQFVAEVEILEGTDLRAVGGYSRSVYIDGVGPSSGDIFSGGASQTLSGYPMELPVRRVILRGPVAEVSTNHPTTSQEQIRMFFGGDGTFRIGRFGVIGLDRRVGQTTFPLD